MREWIRSCSWVASPLLLLGVYAFLPIHAQTGAGLDPEVRVTEASIAGLRDSSYSAYSARGSAGAEPPARSRQSGAP